MTQTLSYKPALPSAPRQVTHRAARRAWAELPVQMWWKCAAAVLVVAAVVGYDASAGRMRDSALMTRGIPVKATLVEVKQTTRAGFAVVRDDNVPVKLLWRNPDGTDRKVDVVLPPAPGYAKVGEELDIRVDPNDPTRWGEVKELLPWWRVLAVPLILLLPIALLLAALAWWQRRRVLEVWRDGRRADGVVVDSKHAAMSLRSRICRFTYADGRDRRVFKMLYPTRHGVLRKGDPIELIALPDAPHRAVAAELYLAGTPSQQGEGEAASG